MSSLDAGDLVRIDEMLAVLTPPFEFTIADVQRDGELGAAVRRRALIVRPLPIAIWVFPGARRFG